MQHLETAVIVAATTPAWLAGHHVGDYWVQTPTQATRKGDPGLPGWLAAGRHAGTYTLATAATVSLTWWLLALPITLTGFLAGQAASGLTHLVIDRRWTLRWLVAHLHPGKLGFYDHGGGAPHLDQAAHMVCLAAAALLTGLGS